ncbi:MAG: DUF1285 domain-containing protein [Alphaproteobacteria bacterium]|nr:DUF1285 domain-containing protein [Alphaproteobacteria bacterium]
MEKSLSGSPSDKLKESLEGGLLGDKSGVPNGQLFCGDIDMRIARDGTWFYHGSPIERKQLVKLFGSILKRDSQGDFWLETPAEKCRIQVEDAPFQAVELSVDGAGQNQCLSFRTNVDDIVIAGPENQIRVMIDSETQEPSPYIVVRAGIEALITRAIFYDLVELAIEKQGERGTDLGVWSNGVCFTLGQVD